MTENQNQNHEYCDVCQKYINNSWWANHLKTKTQGGTLTKFQKPPKMTQKPLYFENSQNPKSAKKGQKKSKKS